MTTAAPHWTPALLYENGPDGDVHCTLCPHRCRLRDGETGLCRVRRRVGDTVETATVATSVAHLDPIERKPFYHYKPGVQALTIAAPGCSFLCSYCVNYRISQFGRPAGSDWAATPVTDPDALVHQAAEAGAVLALSYSEPSLAIELTLALAGRGVPLVWKSNGFLTPEALDLVVPVLDAVNIDVKAADEDKHRALTGGSLQPVLDTIARLAASGVWVEVCTPLIPGISDHPDQLRRIAATIAAINPAIPWHLLRFTPTFRMSADRPTSPDQLAAGQEIGRASGLEHVYVERALDAPGRTTTCPNCRTPVITREVWSAVNSRLKAGACPSCATPIAGRW